MTRLLPLLLVAWPASASTATASVSVSASIASYARVEVDGECGRLESNAPEALAWLDGVPLAANEGWACPVVMYAEARRP
jgi:hypothetical protein